MTEGLSADFVWGVSTSSYQIEGAVAEDGRGSSIWDTYCRQAGRIANGDRGDVACDHYHRYAEDIALMRELGVGAYRFSTAWPRVLPQGRGRANEAGLAFYDRLIDALLAARIEPWLCLYHWDLPQALEDRGGWLNRDSAGWFADYTALVARRYGDRVRRFATFNEPSIFTLFGYGFGGHPPGISSRMLLPRAVHHVNLAHGTAIDVLRACAQTASIGAIHNWQPCVPASDSPEDAAAAVLFEAYWDKAFPDPQLLGTYPAALCDAVEPSVQPGDLARICRPIDWFGLNHYSPVFARANPEAALGIGFGAAPDAMPRSGVGWPIDPGAFRQTLIEVGRRYRLPIVVMENGAGARESPNDAGAIVDEARVSYLQAYTGALDEARAAGADVRGYFVWSLLDNFEWGAGYADRFGLVYVDYPTQRRVPKASFRWYRDLIRQARGRGVT